MFGKPPDTDSVIQLPNGLVNHDREVSPDALAPIPAKSPFEFLTCSAPVPSRYRFPTAVVGTVRPPTMVRPLAELHVEPSGIAIAPVNDGELSGASAERATVESTTLPFASYFGTSPVVVVPVAS